VRARLFWKLGLTYLGLLLVVLLAVGLYSSYVLRRDFIRSADSQLASLLSLAQARLPAFDDPTQLREWTEWVARSGARVTVVDSMGSLLPTRIEIWSPRRASLVSLRFSRPSRTDRDVRYAEARHWEAFSCITQ
jgi:hypothetical protein